MRFAFQSTCRYTCARLVLNSKKKSQTNFQITRMYIILRTYTVCGWYKGNEAPPDSKDEGRYEAAASPREAATSTSAFLPFVNNYCTSCLTPPQLLNCKTDTFTCCKFCPALTEIWKCVCWKDFPGERPSACDSFGPTLSLCNHLKWVHGKVHYFN